MNINLTRKQVRILIKNALMVEIPKYQKAHPEAKGFTMPELLGYLWAYPFHLLYLEYGSNQEVAAHEMGRLLSLTAKELGMRSVKEDRRGKKNAITRHFFV